MHTLYLSYIHYIYHIIIWYDMWYNYILQYVIISHVISCNILYYKICCSAPLAAPVHNYVGLYQRFGFIEDLQGILWYKKKNWLHRQIFFFGFIEDFQGILWYKFSQVSARDLQKGNTFYVCNKKNTRVVKSKG